MQLRHVTHIYWFYRAHSFTYANEDFRLFRQLIKCHLHSFLHSIHWVAPHLLSHFIIIRFTQCSKFNSNSYRRFRIISVFRRYSYCIDFLHATSQRDGWQFESWRITAPRVYPVLLIFIRICPYFHSVSSTFPSRLHKLIASSFRLARFRHLDFAYSLNFHSHAQTHDKITAENTAHNFPLSIHHVADVVTSKIKSMRWGMPSHAVANK